MTNIKIQFIDFSVMNGYPRHPDFVFDTQEYIFVRLDERDVIPTPHPEPNRVIFYYEGENSISYYPFYTNKINFRYKALKDVEFEYLIGIHFNGEYNGILGNISIKKNETFSFEFPIPPIENFYQDGLISLDIAYNKPKDLKVYTKLNGQIMQAKQVFTKQNGVIIPVKSIHKRP